MMLKKAIAALQSLRKRVSRPTALGRSAALAVTVLEVRATPAATPNFVPLLAPPPITVVANFAPPPPGAPVIVTPAPAALRLDFIGPREGTPQATESDDWDQAVVPQQQQSDAPPAQTSADDAAIEEEMAEWLAAQADS